MRQRNLAIVALILVTTCAGPAPEPEVEVDPTSLRTIAQGELVGFTGRYGNHVWLGIPFAKPPVGELRWRAPQPPAPWEGRREALKNGSPCVQFPSFLGVPADDPNTPLGDEDCLHLSVYAPRRGPAELPQGGERWPVMVWIHGGGNSYGLSASYEAGNLAQGNGVVVVAIQYRLGPLGWLRHAALRADAKDGAEASGNFATLDMIRSLEWVRDNIAAFGGDPGNVTIFGESAGGRNVISLLVANGTEGLFHRAISQSGAVRTDSVTKAENFEDDRQPGSASSSGELLLRLLQKDGRAADRAQAKRVAAELAPAEIARYLRSKSGAEIAIASRRPGPPGATPPSVPNIIADGQLIPAEGIVAALSRSDGHRRVPVILGTNRDENRLFMLVDPNYVKVWFGAVYRMRDPEFYDATGDWLARMWKVDGADSPAAALATNQAEVYAYRFDWDEEPTVLGADFSELLGASHAAEIPFVFGHADEGGLSGIAFNEDNRPGREALSAAMRSYWTEFARTGKPGRGRESQLPEWSAWNPEPGRPKMMIFDTPVATGAELAPVGAGETAGRTPAAAPPPGGTRMSPETLTASDVLAGIAADPRLADPAKRCDVLRQLVLRENLTPDRYAQDCPEHPLVVSAPAGR